MDQEGLGPEALEPRPGKGKLIKIGGVLAVLALSATAAYFFWNRQDSLSEQEYLSRAQAFLANAQLPAAVIEFKNALQANPRNPRTRLDLAQIYLKQGMGAEAEEQLNRTRELGVEKKFIALPLAEALVLQRKYDRVLQEINPGDFVHGTEHLQATRIRADALFGLGRRDEACPLFQQVRATDPKHVPAYWGLIKCAVAKKDFPAAKADMAAALKLEPHNFRSLMLMGDLSQAMGDPPGADAAYGKAISSDPDSIAAWIARASVRLAAGKLELAAADVDAARKIAPDVLMVRYMSALLAYRQGQLRDAQNIIQGVLGRAPEHLPSRLLSGNIAFQLGQYRQADKDLSAVLLWQPEDRNVRLTLARSRLLTAQPEGALAALQPLLAEKVQDAEAFSTAGEAYLQLGHPDKALDYLGKAASLMPEKADLRSKLVVWRLSAGDGAGAVRELEAATKLGSLPQQAEALRIVTQLMGKDFGQALASAERLEKRFPDLAIAHHLKGIAYLGKRDFNGAKRSFERALAMQPTNVATARSLARLDILQGKPDFAQTRYEGVLKHDPGNYEAMMELATLAKKRGRDANYVDWLARAAAAAPRETPPRLLLAQHFLAVKEPLKAVPWARQALDLNSKNLEAMELIGDIQLANGENDNALYSYQQWTIVAPYSALAHYKLGKAQANAGHSVSARESLERALRLKPDYADAAIALVLLAQQDGRHQDAIRYARQVQQHHSGMWEGYALEGDSQEAQGRHAEAVKAYTRAFTLHRSNKLFIRLHQALTKSGNTQQAQQILSVWLKDAPGDIATRLYLGYNHLQGGRNREAQKEFQAALGVDSDSIPALIGMTAALDALGDERALKYAELAFKKSGRNAATSDLLGWMLVSRGEEQRGLELLQRAESLAPDNPMIRYHLAAALAKTGDLGLAKHMLEMLLAKESAFPQRAEALALLKTLPAASQPQRKP